MGVQFPSVSLISPQTWVKWGPSAPPSPLLTGGAQLPRGARSRKTKGENFLHQGRRGLSREQSVQLGDWLQVRPSRPGPGPTRPRSSVRKEGSTPSNRRAPAAPCTHVSDTCRREPGSGLCVRWASTTGGGHVGPAGETPRSPCRPCPGAG